MGDVANNTKKVSSLGISGQIVGEGAVLALALNNSDALSDVVPCIAGDARQQMTISIASCTTSCFCCSVYLRRLVALLTCLSAFAILLVSSRGRSFA